MRFLRPRPRTAALLAFAGSTCLLAVPVSAHSGTGLPGGFWAGFRHPLSGSDHLLAMVCVGIWGAFLGRPLISTLPVIFPVMMVGGAALAMFGFPMPPVELGIALSVVTRGSCIALALSAPVWAAMLVVGAFAVFHGYAHGRELPSAADPLAYSLGFVVATGSLHVLGIGIGFLNKLPQGVLVTRAIGALVSLGGAWFLYRASGL